jgi:hypothetical protein
MELISYKAVGIKYYLCVCTCILALLSGMQIISFMGHNLLSSVTCRAVPNPSTLSHK